MRRRHTRGNDQADLDITAFMNLMIVLVPILLINMIFAHTSILELNFPDATDSAAIDEESLQLQVMILDKNLIVADNKGGVIKQIAAKEGEFDYSLLADTMKALKTRVPEKRDITLMARQDTSYQTLVTIMDTVRSYQTVVAGSVVNAELFPDISISDAPENMESAEDVAQSVLALEKGNVES